MDPTMRPLMDEHVDLLPHIERLRVVADLVDAAPPAVLRSDLEELRAFLHHRLIPHAVAEEQVLYPAVQWALNSSNVTLTMTRDHTEIRRLSAELDAILDESDTLAIGEDQLRDVRRILYSLHAIVSVHFAKEEEIYVPLVKKYFTDREIEELAEDMVVVESKPTAELALS